MEAYELFELINDNTIVDIYSAETCEIIATYDGKESIPEWVNVCGVTDIFVDNNHLCIEIDDVPVEFEED